MKELLANIRKCSLCADQLPLGPRPIVAASPTSKIAIIGQAPGSVVHNTGIPWDDKSGQNLRSWLGISAEQFYDPELIALIPMGFCYPGRGKSGDNPPSPQCAPKWHDALLSKMPDLELTILIGKYAQDYYLKGQAKKNLTETVKHFKEYLPKVFVLPHPSPRNNIWQAKNPWFAEEVLPGLRASVNRLL